MKRTDAFGNVGNLFTDGNPPNTPATIVDDTWLNAVQEEISGAIEFAGLTLNSGDDTQLRQAIQIIAGGGIQTDFLIANNQSATNVTGLIFDKTTIKAARVEYSIERKTSTQDVQEMGHFYVIHDSRDDQWRIALGMTFFDSSGVTFSINSSTGQIQYATDDLTGSSYEGKLRFTTYKHRQTAFA